MKVELPIRDECVIIIGSYINACSLTERLYAVGYPHPVIVFHTEGTRICLADIAAKNALVVKRDVRDSKSLLDALDRIAVPSCKKIIMYTSEKFINTVRSAVESGRLQNVRTFTGAGIGNEVILDRSRFYEFIEKLGCLSCPKTIDSGQDPFAVFGESFIVRPKESFNGTAIHQRVRLVSGQVEFDACLRELRAAGLTPEMWSYQELLSTRPEDTYSVCGWHDVEYRQYFVHRKCMRHPEKTGSGDVVETVTDAPTALLEGVRTVLDAMEYSGPFEIEILYDAGTDSFKVIELNPRFWLQHALMNRLADNFIVRRYLDMPVPLPISPESLPQKYWVNGNRALYYMVTGKFRIFRYLRNGFCYPTLWQSFRWGFHYFKFKREMLKR